MDDYVFYCAANNKALIYAAAFLMEEGAVFVPCPDHTVTHLLLPVPSFDGQGYIKGGISLEALLWQLPEEVTIVGGGLSRQELEGYEKIDLLEDPGYTAENAAITACCAIRLAAVRLPVVWRSCPVLVVGWGRIGKCLARLLYQLGARVAVTARKEQDRSMLRAFGYEALTMEQVDPRKYRVIFNTVPVMVLPDCPGKALKIDLASQPGIGGSDVIHARGLPGKDAPESAGALIARTVLSKLNWEGCP